MNHLNILHAAALAALIPALGAASAVQAQDEPPVQETLQDEAIVEAGQFSGTSGRLAVNMAAGDGNQQAGSAALAIGEVAIASENVVQHGMDAAGDRATAVTISGDAFSGNSGLVSLNVTAGSNNQSANLASLAIGQSGALTDQLLEQSRAPTEPYGGTETASAHRNDSVSVSDDAFSGGSGLFQTNLIGGERNSSANTFSLTVLAGGQP
ncbi:hypothetical protein [Alteraurantiacibacter aquimixticola]|uniref:Adhesin n=1 Tax=Alteraurantiacibacter aquimixticola TaxID=2489173 RepID=A0A4T3F772_9SPHN|nr:hypothetical protein [Alteraurantiacibacter aquimixticola]TIX51552.1 hypothetical protein E5222_03610 [Alteraurantiacibacter aquimixticola]